MLTKLTAPLLLNATLVLPSIALAQSSQPELVYWGEDEGVYRLESSQYKADFFKLANQFESQSNKFFCGPTSAAMVLNALRIRSGGLTLPEDPRLLPDTDRAHLPKGDWSPLYGRYSQNNVLEPSPKSRERVLGKPLVGEDGETKRDFGLQLHQLGALLVAHDVAVTVRVADEGLSDAAIKAELIDNLAQRGDYVIINYSRKTLHQPGGGHISPLAAYHRDSDSFLVMDVTPNKADWVWVGADTLIASMRTHDTVSNRGYVLVKEHDTDGVEAVVAAKVPGVTSEE